MMLRFSVKLMFSNFTTMWKILLYYLIVFVIIAALSLGLLLPTISFFIGKVSDAGLIDNFNGMASSLLNPSELGVYLDNFVAGLGNIIDEFILNGGSLVYSSIMLIVISILAYFLFGLVKLPAAYVINAKMNSQLKLSFTAIFLRKLGKSAKYTLSKMMFAIPFDLFIAVSSLFMLYSIKVFGVFGLTIVSMYFVFILAFRIALFSGWLPAIVVDELPIFKALKYGTKKAFTRFWRIVSSIIISFYMFMIIALAMSIVTFGSALVVLIPIGTLYLLLFELCMYYGATARRYFVDYDTIITPKTLRDKNEELINGINTTSIDGEKMLVDVNKDLKNEIKTIVVEVNDEIKTIDAD